MATGPFSVLVINPGATSTKVAVFRDEEKVLQESIEHGNDDLGKYAKLLDQEPYRKGLILDMLELAGIGVDTLDAIVGRGGMLAPMPGGTYEVNEAMMETVRSARYGEHASNLGCLLAHDFAEMAGCRAYIVDAVSTDELDDVARISGIKEIARKSLFHALNHKAVARQVAKELGKPYEELRLVVAHMGTGLSVGVHVGGRIVDVFDPMNEGAFSGDRSGALPARFLIDMCYSGAYTHREMLKKNNGDGGMAAYLGTKDLRTAWGRAKEGDEYAHLILRAMAYQIAKDIGAMATVCEGKLDAIVLTGGMAHSPDLVRLIRERVEFLAPIKMYPGEEEMDSLAAGALRVLRGEEAARVYVDPKSGQVKE